MKIWMKVLISAIIGLLLGYFLPDNSAIYSFFLNFSKLLIDIGCYVIFPIVFFSVGVAIYELKKDRLWLRVIFRSVIYLLIGVIFLSALGVASAILFSPDRIPMLVKEQLTYQIPSVGQIAAQLFQRNTFLVFVESGDILLPLFFFSLLLGLNFNFDKIITRPVVQFFDSFSRILYHINTFIVEVLSLGTAILSAFFLMQIRRNPEFELFTQFISILAINAALIIFVILPLLLFLFNKKVHPFKQLFAILAPALTAFFSADSYFSLATAIRHGKENLGIPRKVGALTFPLFTLFGKAGTAMVASVSFIVIYQSYFSLSLGLTSYLWIGFFSIVGSLLTFSFPGIGVMVVIAFLSKLYGSGLEDAYLLLLPVLPIMASIAVLIDLTVNLLSSSLIAHHENLTEEIEIKEFI